MNYLQIADALFQKILLIKTKKLVFHNTFKIQWYFRANFFVGQLLQKGVYNQMIKNNVNVGFLLLPKAINNGPVVHPLRASRNLYIQRKNTTKTKKSEQIQA